jgi:hypothetical protein
MNDRPLGVTSSAILSVCFLLILVLPVAENLLHFGPQIGLAEKRRLQKYPVFKWELKAILSYPSGFEAAFNDRFGLRGLLVRSQALAKYYWLHISPSPQVILGRNGWLYLASSIDEFRGITPLRRIRIKQWHKEFRAKKAFLAARGIQYLIVVAPNKETVYPEFLPERITQLRQKLYMDDLLNSLPANPHLDIGRLYLQTDTHWNQLGAAIASDAIIDRLSSWFPELEPRKNRNAFQTSMRKSGGGDLARLMGLEDRLREETIVVPKASQPLRPAALRSGTKIKGTFSQQVVELAGGKQRRQAIVTGDSFTGKLYLFLPAHFRRTLNIRPLVSYKDPFFQSIIETEKPDVYIELVVDRHLANPPRVTTPVAGSSKP